MRNYGFFIDQGYYNTDQPDPTQPDPTNPLYIPISPTPFASNIPQAPVTKPVLNDKSDPYFRSFEQKNADFYLFNEWVGDVEKNGLPDLMMVRLAHDHFGSFNNPVAGLNTPELQMADNDYAVGLLVQTISKSPEWKETAIFIIEDDSQNGPDHVDSHRSIGYIISPYIKRGVVNKNNYNTVSMIRTMEDLLGVGYLGITDANAEPMSDAFTRKPDFTPYTAILPGILCAAPVDPDFIPACKDPSLATTPAIRSLHDGSYWAEQTKGFDYSREDLVEADVFNPILWRGIKGDNVPYPKKRSGEDLSQNRDQLLKNGN